MNPMWLICDIMVAMRYVNAMWLICDMAAMRYVNDFVITPDLVIA